MYVVTNVTCKIIEGPVRLYSVTVTAGPSGAARVAILDGTDMGTPEVTTLRVPVGETLHVTFPNGLYLENGLFAVMLDPPENVLFNFEEAE